MGPDGEIDHVATRFDVERGTLEQPVDPSAESDRNRAAVESDEIVTAGSRPDDVESQRRRTDDLGDPDWLSDRSAGSSIDRLEPFVVDDGDGESTIDAGIVR